ncbi:sulfatase-like hydrolase/transferase, partial [Helicobacter sp. MIT 14-3879]|uniref:sulfatase-like hydrolase/transferase n=1 Tax=Helicobacter sp. MIT 14-3879 TaxID=2040649 RepID=UPI0011C06AB6
MKLRIIKTSIIFISVFLICLLISSFLWITNNYSNDINIDAVIFHIKYPLVGVNKIFIYSYILQATLPSFLVAIFYLKNPKLTLFIISIFIIILLIFSLEFQYLKPISNMQNTTIIGLINIKIIGLYFKSFIFNDDFGIVYILKTLLLMITIALLFLILIKIFNLSFKFYRRYKILHKFSIALIFLYSFYVINDLNIYKFLKPKKYSNFYEQNYIIPTIEPSKNTNNLIIILAESLETSFASMNDSILNSKEVEKINNLIPNLYNLAIKNINFSNNNSFGGIIQTNNTNWTIAGTTGYLCGIPLNMPPQVSPKKFLTNAICISDILNNIGYYQLALLGYDSNFAGSKYFFGEHKINYFDIFDLSKNYETKEGFWGIADSNIFDIAKKVLSSYKKDSPFVLYIPTADTHFPNGYVDKDFCSDLEFGYSSAIKCSDRII